MFGNFNRRSTPNRELSIKGLLGEDIRRLCRASREIRGDSLRAVLSGLEGKGCHLYPLRKY